MAWAHYATNWVQKEELKIGYKKALERKRAFDKNNWGNMLSWENDYINSSIILSYLTNIIFSVLIISPAIIFTKYTPLL